MSDPIDLTACDREPIHVPGSIQPHGLMIVCDHATLTILHVAGDIEGRLGVHDWQGASLSALLSEASQPQHAFETMPGAFGYAGPLTAASGETFDVSLHRSGDYLIAELEPAAPAAPNARALLGRLEAAAASFQHAPLLNVLCERAAAEFRFLTGYDRVMVYRFLEDGAGAVLAENKDPEHYSFLNHHFPSTDIPRQARALYIRNLIRVIPDVDYQPARLRPAWSNPEPLDMSDSVLRSVSPIHVQYLKNMGVGASASVSIIIDGSLWGLVACHNSTPMTIGYDIRAACRMLAGAFARQIKAREDAEGYRERIRLRSFEDDIVALMSREGSLEDVITNHLDEVRRSLGGDGVAVLRGRDLVSDGACPAPAQIRDLAGWIMRQNPEVVYATASLAQDYPAAAGFADRASGLLAIVLSTEEPWLTLWFRAEQVEVIKWAGNPHKDATAADDQILTPRASFAAWSETVRGQSRRWTIPEQEAAARLRLALIDVQRRRQLRDLNRKLLETIGEKDRLIAQKEFLIGEVNHRVQNSLQLVSSFLGLQARASDDPGLHAALDEARKRLNAVALVHRRLYRGDQLEVVNTARYVEELCEDVIGSLGSGWRKLLHLDLSPVMMPMDRAVSMGLILTELIINVNKYAYGGQPGPLQISLTEARANFRLSVADAGSGKASSQRGFGTRMMEALVSQLAGTLHHEDNKPGLRVVLDAPVEARRQAASS